MDTPQSPIPAAPSSLITLNEFLKRVQLCTAKILTVEDIPGKDKLYKIGLEVGNETRTIVSGIKEWYTKEELLGKIIIIVYNLEPKSLGGVLSQGMLLAAEDSEGNFTLITADRPVKSGTVVR